MKSTVYSNAISLFGVFLSSLERMAIFLVFSLASGTAMAVAPSIDLNGPGAGTGNTIALASAASGLATNTATASDTENDSTNWNGGSLTVQRVTSGGVADSSVNDVFNFTSGGLFSATGGTVIKGANASGTLTTGTPFATWAYTSTTGNLVVSFNANASSALVQDVVRHIGYSNATPYGDATIRFGLNDGTSTTNADALVTSSTIYVDQTAYDVSGIAANGFNLAEALAIAKDGDRVLIKDGTYRGQFIATTAVTIDAVNGAAGNVTLEAPDNASMVASLQNNMKGKTRWVILDLRTATPGSGTINVSNLNIDGRYQGPTQAADPSPYPINMSGIATYDTNAVIDHVNVQHIAALWGINGDLEGISRDEGILAEGSTALGVAKVTVTIKNSTLGTFQKAGIQAWGANLIVNITNNTIVGSGVHGLSAQNGIQIGSFNLNRPGTTGVISGNTITNLGAPDALVATGYMATGIYPVTAGAVEIYNNTVTLDPGASANSLIGVDVGYGVYDSRSGVANVHNNTFNGMSVGIMVDSASTSAIHTFSNNTLTTSGGKPVVYWYDPMGNGDVGGETIGSFGAGTSIRVVGENFTSGTVTAGNGVGLAANSVQVESSGGNTILHIDTTAGGASTPITVTLNGIYQTSSFVRAGEYLSALPNYTVTFDNNGGAGSMAPQVANVATNLTSNTFTKVGYTFAGWNTVPGGGGIAYANAASYPFTASATLYAQWTLIPVPDVVPVNPIPTVITPPPVPGVGSNQLTPLNLSSGDGPAMTNCLRDFLRTVIGANAVYQGQTADGGARIGQTGLVISFYALEATTSTNYGLGQGAGIYLRSSNPLAVVTSCGTFTTTPAVYNLTEWGGFLNGMGLSAQFNAQGVMTVVVGGTTYVARPDYLVTQGTPGAPRLLTGSDGLMRFTDSAGNVQILYPAFLDPETLSNQVAQAVGGWTVIQTDGTALVTLLSGQKFVLTPDMTLGTVPSEQFAAGWWQDGPNHYRYRNSSFSATSQGFTVRAIP